MASPKGTGPYHTKLGLQCTRSSLRPPQRKRARVTGARRRCGSGGVAAVGGGGDGGGDGGPA
eukprot:2209727-Prymnesium_polylepis.1